MICRNDLPSESLLRLEDSTIKFFSRCCWCYPKNQKTFAHIVYKVIDGTSRRCKYNVFRASSHDFKIFFLPNFQKYCSIFRFKIQFRDHRFYATSTSSADSGADKSSIPSI